MTPDHDPHPRWGGREWADLTDEEFRGRVAGQIDLLVQVSLASQHHMMKIEKRLGERDVRMGVIGIFAGAIGGIILAFAWLLLHLAARVAS